MDLLIHPMHATKVMFALAVGAALALAASAGTEAPVDYVTPLKQRIAERQACLDNLEQQVAGVSDLDDDRAAALRRQIREVLGQREFRESLMPAALQAGYDDGFFICGSDEKFLLTVGGVLQFRWTHYASQSRNRYLSPRLHRNDRTGFDVQRLRLKFEGQAYTPDLTYQVEINGDASRNYQYSQEYAWVNYRFSDALQVRAGLLKAASTRSEMNSSGTLQFVDRPMTNAVFTLDRGVGVKFWGRLFEKRVTWHLDVVNSFLGVGNSTITPDPPRMDNNPGLVFHAIWHALGDKPGKEFKGQADLEWHETPALDAGFHYAFNEDEGDGSTMVVPFPIPRRPGGVGGYGNATTNGMQVHQFGLDTQLKYRGFSATAEYIFRTLDPRHAASPPYTPWWQLTRQGDTTVMHGAYLQMGYLLPIPGLERKLELVGRVGGISAAAEDVEGSWEYAAGLNYYIEGEKVKLQTDVSRVYESPIRSTSGSLANVNDSALFWRVQLTVAF